MKVEIIKSFIRFAEGVRVIRYDGVDMYDVKGFHKYLTFTELYDYYFKK